MWFAIGFLVAVIRIGIDFLTTEHEYKREMDEYNKSVVAFDVFAHEFIKAAGYEENEAEIIEMVRRKLG